MANRIRDFVGSCVSKAGRRTSNSKQPRRRPRLTRGQPQIETLETRSLLAVDLQVTRFYSQSDSNALHLNYSIAGTTGLSSDPTWKVYKSYDGVSLDQMLGSGSLANRNNGTYVHVVSLPAFTDTDDDYFLVATISHGEELAPETSNNALQYEGGAFLNNWVLYIHGSDTTAAGDNISVAMPSSLTISASNSAIPFNYNNTILPVLVTQVRARLHGGNDVFTAQPGMGKPLWVIGGEGSDSITGGLGNDRLYGDSDGIAAASIVDRKIFYNQSAFDGNTAGHGPADDAAIATDKHALLPGETATFKNYTSYASGINGLMIDIDNPRHIPTAADFSFAVGNTADPSQWTPLVTAPTVSVRPDEGLNGSDRITLTWPSGTITKKWLRVTAKTSLGLPAPDVFYFGNAVGEGGDSTTDARVSSIDELLARNNPHSLLNPVGVSYPYDYDRDTRVSSVDEIIARNNATTVVTRLILLAAPFESSSNDTIYGGAGNDSIYSFAGADLLHGESGNDTLTIGNGTILQGQHTAQNLIAWGEADADVFVVKSTSPGTHTFLDGGGAPSGTHDIYHIGGLDSGQLDSIQGYLMVNTALPGHDKLKLHDQLSTSGHTYTLNSNSFVRSEHAGSINFNGSEIDQVDLFAGTGNDIINVPTSPVYVYVLGNEGDDQISVKNSFSIANVNGEGGNDTITMWEPGFANSDSWATGGSGDDVITAIYPVVNRLYFDGGAGDADTIDATHQELGSLVLPTAVTGIEILDAKHNYLTSLPVNMPASLTTLDLRYNHLNLGSGQPGDLFDQGTGNPFNVLTALRKLYLYGNADPSFAVQPDPDLTMLKGKVLRVDLQPVGLEAAERKMTAAEAIPALAKALHYLPLEMYEYVLNNYDFQLYAGLMKGTLATIHTREGNAWDLSNLLIDLLKSISLTAAFATDAAGNPARISISQAKGKEWIGTRHSVATMDLFKMSGLNLPASTTENDSLVFDHTWVVVQLPGYANTKLDPSWKFKDRYARTELLLDQIRKPDGTTKYGNVGEMINSIVPLVSNFHAQSNAYFAPLGDELRDDLPHEWFEDRVTDLLAKRATGISLAEFAYDGPIRTHYIAAPPTTLDVTVLTNPGETFTQYPLAEKWTHRIRVSSEYAELTGSSPWAPVTLSVPEFGLEPITIQWAPGSLDDPELYVGTSRKSNGSGLSLPLNITIEVIEPGSDSAADRSYSFIRKPGVLMAIGLEANQISDRLLSHWQGELNAAVNDVFTSSSYIQPGNFTPHEVGKFLAYSSAKYFDRIGDTSTRLDRLYQTLSTHSHIQVAMASGNQTINSGDVKGFDANLPIANQSPIQLMFPVTPGNLFIDVPGAIGDAVSIDNDDSAENARFVLYGHAGSAHEHAIWEELTNTPGMSTVRVLQVARKQNIPVTRFTATTWDSSYAAHPFLDTDAVDAITDEFEAGAVWVDAPERRIGWLNFLGVGYVSKFANGTTGYVILPENGIPGNGGMLADLNFDVPLKISSTSTQLVYGDPVNVANGAVYDDMVDISLPGIGLPVAFGRHYDSSTVTIPFEQPLDQFGQPVGPDIVGDSTLGPGWWHSYSDRLYFFSDKIVWIDSQGQRHSFTSNGGDNYSSPKTFRGKLQVYRENGTVTLYRITQKDGTHRGFSAAGQLQWIRDINGVNQLTMSYLDGRLSQVSHSISGGHSLSLSYSNGKLSQIQDDTGRIWRYTVSATTGNLDKVESPPAPFGGTTPEATVRYFYNSTLGGTAAQGLLREIQGANGASIVHTYYPNGRAFQAIDQQGYVQTFDYDLYRQRSIFTDERGHTTTYSYDNDGNLKRVAHPDGSKERFVWNSAAATQTDHINVFGTREHVTYSGDGLANVTKIEVQQQTGGDSTLGTDSYTTITQLDNGSSVDVATSFEYQPMTFSDGTWMGTLLKKVTRPGGVPGLPRHTEYVYGGAGYLAHELRQVIENGISVTIIFPFSELSSLHYRNGLTQQIWVRGPNASDPTVSNSSFDYDKYGQTTYRRTDINPTAFESSTWSYFQPNNAGGFPVGYLESQTDNRGKQTKYEVDKLGRRTRMILPALNEATPEAEANRDWTYQYNVSGQVVKTYDPLSTGVFNHVTEAAYDPRQLLVKSIAADGTITTAGYDAARNAVFATDQLGRATRTEYDERNRPIRVTLADGSSSRSYYDAAGRVVASVDPLGNMTRFEYDRLGNLVKRIEPDPDKTLTTDGALVSPEWQYTYDAVGNQVTVKSPRTDVNAITTYEYDNAGRVTKRIDPFVAALGVSPIWQYKYDALGRQTEAINPTEQRTVNIYDMAGRLLEVHNYGNTGVLESKSKFGYDANGNMTSSVDPRAFEPNAGPESSWTTSYIYNSRNQQTQLTRPQTTWTDAAGVLQTQNHISRTSYDQLGNVIDTFDESNRQTTFTYDVRNRMTSSKYLPLSLKTVTRYDTVGNVVQVTEFNDVPDPANRLVQESRFEYDELGRQTTAIDKLGFKTRTAYDDAGNVTSVTDASGNVTSYTYDGLHRLTQETKEGLVASRDYRTYEYDPAGNLVHYVSRNIGHQYFDYDELNRKKRERISAGVLPAFPVMVERNYTYDAAGRLRTARDWKVEHGGTETNYTYTYDTLGRLEWETSNPPFGDEISLQRFYDDAGNRGTLTVYRNGVSEYVTGATLNKLGEETAVSITTPGSSATRKATFDYFEAGELRTIKRFSDPLGQAVGSTVYTLEPNGSGQLDTITHRGPSNVVASQNLDYDVLSRITQVTNAGLSDTLNEGAVQYAFDRGDQLVKGQRPGQALDENFTYDETGNRSGGLHQTIGHNRLTSDGVYTYDYDAEGNVKSRSKSGEHVVYGYDFFNRLISVQYKTSPSGSLTKEVKYAYDINNRRISKSVDHDASPSTPSQVTQYVYDRDRVIMELDVPDGGTPIVTHRYMHADAVDTALADEVSSGTRWLLSDYEGSIRDIVSFDGKRLNHIRYDAFGKVIAEWNPNIDTAYGYAGGVRDEETGLQQNGARYYNPANGRFTSEDPIGMADGVNVYTYAHNDPVNGVDPAGLATKSLTGGSSGFDFLYQNSFAYKNLSGGPPLQQPALIFNQFDPKTAGEPLRQLWNDIEAGDYSGEGVARREVERMVADGVHVVGHDSAKSRRLAEAELYKGTGIGSIALQTFYEFNYGVNRAAGGAQRYAENETVHQAAMRGRQDVALKVADYSMTAATGVRGLQHFAKTQFKPSVDLQARLERNFRSNQKLIDDIARRSERKIGGIGNVAGIEKHAYAKRLLDRYQEMFGHRGLHTEVSVINGGRVKYGTKGSVRLDVIEGSIANPTAIYDYKFGNATLSLLRQNQIRTVTGYGAHVPIVEVKP